MKCIKASVEQITPNIIGLDYLKAIEKAGRVCYKSENKITNESALEFVEKLIKNGHEAMIEHGPSISMKFICDRGVSHEIVRHRLFSFAQESTRYCNYGKNDEITVIEPCFWPNTQQTSLTNKLHNNYKWNAWYEACATAEKIYMFLIQKGASPQEARSVLPNSLKTELIVENGVIFLNYVVHQRLIRK